MTPPQTAGPGANTKADVTRTINLDLGKTPNDSSQWAPSQVSPTHTNPPLLSPFLDGRYSSRPTLRRALSDSTLQESVARESAGGFKIVITKPGEERRPKTVEDLDDRLPHFLEVSIPSGKLGTPRWSARGTPFIRGSSYAPTEEFRTSRNPSPLTLRFPPDIGSRRPGSDLKNRAAHLSGSQRSRYISAAGMSHDHALRATYMSTHLVIEPGMFDALTFKPACDDRAIVRYSPSTGAVTAATPPRLVAEITSATFLDYELLSDFFLTFRSYLAPLDLLQMLFARMRWSLATNDEVGTVVRVRTFVALRHWILNYFVDDFVVEYEMRKHFCVLMNSLSEEMIQCPSARRVQLKILAELKKCWRRVCAQFWDGPEFDANLPPDVPITPGGIPGHRNPSLDPDFWKQFFHDGPPTLDQVYAPLASNPPDVESSFYREIVQAGAAETGWEPEHRPGTPTNEKEEQAIMQSQLSPTSISSAEAVSCSLPLKLSNQKARRRLGAHPADPSTIFTIPEPVAAAPRTLQGKRVRPEQSHKRNKSTPETREDDAALETLLRKNTETIMALPYAGSLVRGNVLPPGQAFVEVLTPNTLNGISRQTTYLRLEMDHDVKDRDPPAAMSGQGMRRLIGSVRRVLSTKGQDLSPTQGNFSITPIGPRGVTANRLPGTAIVPQSRPTANTTRPRVRIDLLGAEVVEDFKRVVREDAAEATRSFHGSIPSTPTTIRMPDENRDNISRLGRQSPLPRDIDDKRPFSEGGLTSGSKSIVIVDDTLRAPQDQFTMAGALGNFTPSVDAFADSCIPSGAEPSPPSTPEGRTSDTPRRSSYLLGQHVLRPARSADDLPPFVPDLDTLRGEGPSRAYYDSERPTMHARRPSSDLYRQSASRPPLSGIVRRALRRQSRSSTSNGTTGPRRRASYHSGMDRRSTARSFDATTYSYRSSLSQRHSMTVPVPQPLRVLRRRPGGDLRAVNNVVNLGHTGLRRSRSMGSMTTGTYASSFGTSLILSTGVPRESTVLADGVYSDNSREPRGLFSLGAMAEKPKRKISLLTSFGSRPVMRPSFEAEAQKLANIPDDDDDGGVESALLKLEGKYDKKRLKLSMEPIVADLRPARRLLRPTLPEPVSEPQVVAEEKKKHRHEHVVEAGLSPYSPPPDMDSSPLPSSASSFVTSGRPSMRPQVQVDVQSVSSGSTSNSYVSVPLLQRGLTDDGTRSRAGWTNRSIFQDDDDDGSSADEVALDRKSYEFVEKSSSLDDVAPGESGPSRKRGNTTTSQISQGSFLNVDDTDDDELSSELSETPMEDDEDMAFPSLRPNASLAKIRTSGSDLRPAANQPSPASMSPQLQQVSQLRNEQVYGVKPLPPTPDYTPTFDHAGSTNSKGTPDPTGVNAALRNAADVIEREASTRKYSAHLPFILAFESDILAQQFTLIEKDALNEIDWKELIDMRWKNAENNDCRSWVHFLRDTDARGVEVVIARFNIVVKWAISEIVLTQDIEERARCIIKYIHIASHCRRYRNYATMAQIAVALTSGEIGRLSNTWKLVPASDVRILHDLEALISPTRNFYALRAEMEGGTGTGCIPFVGIYTHDLIFNSQRPGEIASSPTTAPLVNFERCRVAAGIVKALLRLLEASAAYDFEPIEGITERCLWMSALSDEEIRSLSSAIE